jgi:threonine dehydrogenase-like Zn-dependent dehydrogenase
MMGQQHGFEVHVYDRNKDGPKPELVRQLGATYHSGDLGKLSPDITIECTGATPVVLDVIGRAASSGIVCLAGVSSGGRPVQFDAGIFNRNMVLQNQVVFGSVNANRRHYKAAADALAKADKQWLGQLINRRVPLSRWSEAFDDRKDDIKVVLDFAA